MDALAVVLQETGVMIGDGIVVAYPEQGFLTICDTVVTASQAQRVSQTLKEASEWPRTGPPRERLWLACPFEIESGDHECVAYFDDIGLTQEQVVYYRDRVQVALGALAAAQQAPTRKSGPVREWMTAGVLHR